MTDINLKFRVSEELKEWYYNTPFYKTYNFVKTNKKKVGITLLLGASLATHVGVRGPVKAVQDYSNIGSGLEYIVDKGKNIFSSEDTISTVTPSTETKIESKKTVNKKITKSKSKKSKINKRKAKSNIFIRGKEAVDICKESTKYGIKIPGINIALGTLEKKYNNSRFNKGTRVIFTGKEIRGASKDLPDEYKLTGSKGYSSLESITIYNNTSTIGNPNKCWIKIKLTEADTFKIPHTLDCSIVAKNDIKGILSYKMNKKTKTIDKLNMYFHTDGIRFIPSRKVRGLTFGFVSPFDIGIARINRESNEYIGKIGYIEDKKEKGLKLNLTTCAKTSIRRYKEDFK